ncbi:MAG: hypothetical protein ACON49_07450 [Candidatus Puniceispirillaceae bacterium]
MFYTSVASYAYAAEAPVNSGTITAPFNRLAPIVLDGSDSVLPLRLQTLTDKAWQSDESLMAYERHLTDVSPDGPDNNALMKVRFATADHFYLIAKNSPYLSDISKVKKTDIQAIFTLPDMPSVVTGPILSQAPFDISYIIWPEDQRQLPANLLISRPLQALVFYNSHSSAFSGQMIFSTSDFSGKVTLTDAKSDIMFTFSNPDFSHQTISTASAILHYDGALLDSLVTFARLIPDEAHASEITIWGQFVVTDPHQTMLQKGVFTSLDWPEILAVP